MEVQVHAFELPGGEHSGKIWGATRGLGWPLRRVERYGWDELPKAFHEGSDRFTFVGPYERRLGIGAYSYYDGIRPYEAPARGDQSRLMTTVPRGVIVTLRLDRSATRTQYMARWDHGSHAVHAAEHHRRLPWSLSLLAGPFYGGKEPAPADIYIRIRRTK